jgi:hypothetical protein
MNAGAARKPALRLSAGHGRAIAGRDAPDDFDIIFDNIFNIVLDINFNVIFDEHITTVRMKKSENLLHRFQSGMAPFRMI